MYIYYHNHQLTMTRHLYYLLLLPILLLNLACGNDNQSNNGAAPQHTPADLKGNWYKRFTGTIAGQPVVVNMYRVGDGNRDIGAFSGGTYYYVNKSELLDLDIQPDTTKANALLVTEYVQTDRPNEEAVVRYNTWNITIQGDKVSGTFHKANSTQTFAIELKEDYSDACRFELIMVKDSTKAKGPRWSAAASATFIGISPVHTGSKDDEDFINHALMQLVNPARANEMTDIKEYARNVIKTYLDSFRKDMEDMQQDSTEEAPMQDYEQSDYLFPDYNANGMLIVRDMWYSYSGGAHGMHGSAYINADIQRRKILKLSDVITIDSNAISALLAAEVRRKYKAKPNEPLSNVILVDTVRATDNIIIADKGITFCYNPYEISSYADGEVKLFIPYSKLKPYLKQDFVERMKLKL